MINAFHTSFLPGVHFGNGALRQVPELAREFGTRALLVMGMQSFGQSVRWPDFKARCEQHGLILHLVNVVGEPSPQLVDDTVTQFRNTNIEVVIGLGGGSALDAAKAIAGLLKIKRSVMDFLEGVGPELEYSGPSVPFIAVPTTAGTGSEMTKNAVLSVQGKEGFKKSFRDEKLLARRVVVDPDLLDTCPSEVIAANGMDAFTQLLESYVSLKANEFTDTLAINGMQSIKRSLLPWFLKGGSDSDAQSHMAYASMLSGITLAQVGLGSVHGLASPLGAFYPIPHGVVCGTLLPEASKVNINALKEREPDNPALEKYRIVAQLLSGEKIEAPEKCYETLARTLFEWKKILGLPGLSNFGVEASDLGHIVAHSRGSSMKTNPIVLTDMEIKQILQSCL